jgi:imidazolonepropionase-like amidohydrolase
MKILCISFLPILFYSNCAGQTIKLLNGNYYQNGQFKKISSLYIANAVFSFKQPETVDTVIDLNGKFILPPFAEAHTHKIDNPGDVNKNIKSLVNEGVFYALVLNNFSSNVENNRKILAETKWLDVAFANGGITATGQHPSFAYERTLSGLQEWWLPENTRKIKNSKKAENDAYWIMDNNADVDAKWNAFLKTKPDIVKVYLMNAANNTNQEPKSLSEDIVQNIATKAKKAKLRVVAHIETLSDLKIGLRCGIRLYAHMPYYNANFLKELPADYTFSKAEIKLIKKLKPVIIPTLMVNEDFSIVRNEKNNFKGELDSIIYKRVLNFQRNRIQQLKYFGFAFAIGSDRDTFLPELIYWLKNNILEKSTVFTIATKITPLLIFPDRKIGEFRNGYEGSLLVFNKNPLEDIEELKKIELSIKNGQILK